MKRKVLIVAAAMALAPCSRAAEPTSGTINVTGQDYAFRGSPSLRPPSSDFRTIRSYFVGELNR